MVKLINKGVLETRPVYVSLKDHINAHFLTIAYRTEHN